MIVIRIDVAADVEPCWSPIAAERDGGWAIVQDGNRLVCAIGDPLDGESVSAFVPSSEYSAEWRIDGFAHEIWFGDTMAGRAIESRQFVRGEHLSVGSDPWHPHRVFRGHAAVEVIDG